MNRFNIPSSALGLNAPGNILDAGAALKTLIAVIDPTDVYSGAEGLLAAVTPLDNVTLAWPSNGPGFLEGAYQAIPFLRPPIIGLIAYVDALSNTYGAA